jgi:hypothetical protein
MSILPKYLVLSFDSYEYPDGGWNIEHCGSNLVKVVKVATTICARDVVVLRTRDGKILWQGKC